MNAYLAEFIGTAVLIILGNGVVANVVLGKTKGNGAGWITAKATAIVFKLFILSQDCVVIYNVNTENNL